MMLEIPPMPVGCMCVKTRKEFGRMRTAHNLECNREDDVPCKTAKGYLHILL